MDRAGPAFHQPGQAWFNPGLEFSFDSPAIHGRERRRPNPFAAVRAGARAAAVRGERPRSPALKRRAIEYAYSKSEEAPGYRIRQKAKNFSPDSSDWKSEIGSGKSLRSGLVKAVLQSIIFAGA